SRRAASSRPDKPNSGSSASRFSRCNTSSLAKGRRPSRTSAIAGWYRTRQASAKAAQSRSGSPWLAAKTAPRRTMEPRQSTIVPKTSNSSASTSGTAPAGATALLRGAQRLHPGAALVRRDPAVLDDQGVVGRVGDRFNIGEGIAVDREQIG